MHRLKQLWSSLRSSFWFVPTLMVTGSVVLALVVIEAELAVEGRWLSRWPRVFGATPEGARQLLATISGSMMTVMGVTFSTTLVALALASTQYTSRILRNFMRSRVTQTTLGVFAGIFTYCLIVLRTIRGGVGDAVFVPGLALFFAFVLALGGIGVLIFFIHHIASSIQASSIIASVAEETTAAIGRLCPPGVGADPDEAYGDERRTLAPSADTRWRAVPAATDGYIQNVDQAALVRLATDNKTVVRMEHGIGEFVVRNTGLASLAMDRAPEQDTIAALNNAYSVSSHRTVDQDPAFGIRQIVDMALKALSPGVNDISTAIICVDSLTAVLCRLGERKLPPSRHYDDGQELRLISIEPTFEGLLGEAFDQIRRNAAGNLSIMSRMLRALEVIAGQTQQPRHRLALRVQVHWIAELAGHTIDAPHDRDRIRTRVARVFKAIDAAGGTPWGHPRQAHERCADGL